MLRWKNSVRLLQNMVWGLRQGLIYQRIYRLYSQKLHSQQYNYGCFGQFDNRHFSWLNRRRWPITASRSSSASGRKVFIPAMTRRPRVRLRRKETIELNQVNISEEDMALIKQGFYQLVNGWVATTGARLHQTPRSPSAQNQGLLETLSTVAHLLSIPM